MICVYNRLQIISGINNNFDFFSFFLKPQLIEAFEA